MQVFRQSPQGRGLSENKDTRLLFVNMFFRFPFYVLALSNCFSKLYKIYCYVIRPRSLLLMGCASRSSFVSAAQAVSWGSGALGREGGLG